MNADKAERLLKAKDTFADAYRLIDDRSSAISEFETSQALFAQLGDVCEAALAENWALQLLPDVGKISESRVRFAAMIADAKRRKFNLLLAPAHYWLAISDYVQGRFSDSNQNLKIALRLAETGNNDFEIQHATEVLTSNYSDLGELEQALSFAGKMLSAQGSYYESLDQSLRDLETLADLSLKLNFASTSLSLAKEGLSMAQEKLARDNRAKNQHKPPNQTQQHGRVTANLRRMVYGAKAKGDLPAALGFAEQSKAIALGLSDSPENTKTIAEIYLTLGEVKSQMRECDEALTDYDRALELYRRLPEFTASAYSIHKGRLFCFQQLDRREAFAKELQTVLDLSEEYRATIREDDSRQAFFASEQEVFDTATANAIKEGDSRRAFDFTEKSRARSLLDFVESDKPIAEVEKSFGSVTDPLSLAEIQARLPEQVQLVQYAVLPDKLAIWVVSKTRFDLVERSITAKELAQKIEDYQAALVGKAPATELKQAAAELYELLIPTDLATDKQICLIADKSIHQLAFASLVAPGGRYLLEDHALSYAPSASVLVLATENASRKDQVTNERLLSIGNPDFDREENPNLPDLGSAEAEARSIATDYANGQPLIGGDATKDKFLHSFTEVEVIHFAGHFLANRQSPGNSKLLFAGGELRSSELGTYKLPLAKLVVLSACETGFERYDKSEGAIGIARTFLALGAPLVVASQWQVDSEPTKDLMIAFHRNRKDNRLTSAESLRRAQLEILNDDRTRAPFYWAAFSLFGGYSNY